MYRQGLYYYGFVCFVLLCQLALLSPRRATIPTAVRLALLTDSILLSLLVLELLLAAGAFHGNYAWTPLAAKAADERINTGHMINAWSNPFAFNDRAFPLERPQGVQRIAVLGDSFVFGHGLSLNETWGAKLRELFARSEPQTEVLLWGKNGWSTRAQLRFLREWGIRFRPDLVVLGFVANDPSPCQNDCYSSLEWQNTYLLDPVRWLFPESINFLTSLINNAIETRTGRNGYANFVDSLYSAENLGAYEQVLAELAELGRVQNLPIVVVLTPDNTAPIFEEKYFALIKPLLEKHGLPFLDLYPPAKARLGHLPPEELRASRANGHPGSRLTSVFAEEVFNYLRSQPVFTRSEPPAREPETALDGA